jgi:transposase
MGRKNQRKKIELNDEDMMIIKEITKSRTEEFRKVQRAKIILMSIEGVNDKQIAREMKINRGTVINTLSKCVTMGMEAALNDLARPGKPKIINDEEEKWIISIACRKPKDLGYSSELWTLNSLLTHIKKEAEIKGYIELLKLSKSKLWTILNKNEIKPHKIRYYLEKRDPEFEAKFIDILYAYKEVEIINKNLASDNNFKPEKITISYDEKPGLQGLENIAPDLMPQVGKYSTIGRDYEYRRLGTLSILAGIDLHSGIITEIVSETHKSSDFIEFLKLLNVNYHKDLKIRIILDNHSAHISKETKAYLTTVQNRFEFIFTPKHASWLNIIEMFFSKMARSFLRGIRVSSLEELKYRIHKYIKEVNETPVVFRWKYKMNEIVL